MMKKSTMFLLLILLTLSLVSCKDEECDFAKTKVMEPNQQIVSTLKAILAETQSPNHTFYQLSYDIQRACESFVVETEHTPYVVTELREMAYGKIKSTQYFCNEKVTIPTTVCGEPYFGRGTGCSNGTQNFCRSYGVKAKTPKNTNIAFYQKNSAVFLATHLERMNRLTVELCKTVEAWKGFENPELLAEISEMILAEHEKFVEPYGTQFYNNVCRN